jgi:hypothetical protein
MEKNITFRSTSQSSLQESRRITMKAMVSFVTLWMSLTSILTPAFSQSWINGTSPSVNRTFYGNNTFGVNNSSRRFYLTSFPASSSPVDHNLSSYLRGCNVTITLANDRHVKQEGKLWLTLEGQSRIQVTPQSLYLRPGYSYTFFVASTVSIERVPSVLLRWKKHFSLARLMSSDSIHVSHVMLSGSSDAGFFVNRRLCSSSTPLHLKSGIDYKFWIWC